MPNLNKELFSSKKQDWETPLNLFEKLNEIFNFNLDVCAIPETEKCKKYFTPEIDGLSQEWYGTCWMNPPYNRYQVNWIKKASEEVIKHNSIVVCLIPARPDTKVWHNIIFKNADTICFLKGRLKFSNSKESAPFPSAIVIFGKISFKQRNALEELGKIFKIA
ncbi:DNA N-6-adenine-methyltransferase [Clostridium perfringens]|nr:DNA N-6-adenine-methyltransferase [Clostridium perfringens]